MRPAFLIPLAVFRSRPLRMSAQATPRAPSTLAEFGRSVLTSPDPVEKVRVTNLAAALWGRRSGRDGGGGGDGGDGGGDSDYGGVRIAVGGPLGPSAVPEAPARPKAPRIVASPNEMPTQRDAVAAGLCTRETYLLHALAHVELNAIDLAWDTALRFGSDDDGGEGKNSGGGGGGGTMPQEWFADFLSIAVDEARHFGWLSARLVELGSHYGALPVHRIIWDAADVSKASRRERLAVGQLCQEARGLDAGPRLAERLVGFGDVQSAAIVRQISEEEVAHVRIGVRWFLRECDAAGDGDRAITVFHDIALRLSNQGAFSPPFNEERRREAGLDPEWYAPVADQMRAERDRRGLTTIRP